MKRLECSDCMDCRRVGVISGEIGVLSGDIKVISRYWSGQWTDKKYQWRG